MNFVHAPTVWFCAVLRSVFNQGALTSLPRDDPAVTTMPIHWGAVPFVLIRLVMVSRIIESGIVSSGLDKEGSMTWTRCMEWKSHAQSRPDTWNHLGCRGTPAAEGGEIRLNDGIKEEPGWRQEALDAA